MGLFLKYWHDTVTKLYIYKIKSISMIKINVKKTNTKNLKN